MVQFCLSLVGDICSMAEFDAYAFIQVFQLRTCLKQSSLDFLLQLY